jgi:hypothetical protein
MLRVLKVQAPTEDKIDDVMDASTKEWNVRSINSQNTTWTFIMRFQYKIQQGRHF